MKRIVIASLAVASLAVAATGHASATRTVKVADDVFKPARMTVSKGTTVRWRWVGNNPHNVVVTRGPMRFRSDTDDSGTFRRKLRKRGTYRITCTIHPGMDQRIRVR